MIAMCLATAIGLIVFLRGLAVPRSETREEAAIRLITEIRALSSASVSGVEEGREGIQRASERAMELRRELALLGDDAASLVAEALNHSTESERYNLLWSLAQFPAGCPAVLAYLRDHRPHGSSSDAFPAAQMLLDNAAEEFLDDAISLSHSRDARARMVAALALGKFSSAPRAISRLNEMALHDEDRATRDNAKAMLIDIDKK